MFQLEVENIKCGGCANGIKNKLSDIQGLTNLTVDVENGVVSFEGNEGAEEEVATVLAKMGYPRVGEGTTLQKAKSYVSCMIGKMS